MKKVLLYIVLLLVAVSAAHAAKSYVSQVGKFYIEYPESWNKVPFTTIDMYLASRNAGQHTYEYDAVLSANPPEDFQNGPYFFLTIDSTGEMTENIKDSILDDISRSFIGDVNHKPINDINSDISPRNPTYDKSRDIVVIVNVVKQSDQTEFRNLIIMKFYNQGVANFFCNAPDSLYKQTRETFFAIANSLGTDNLEAHLPKEEIKLADIDIDKLTEKQEDNNTTVFGLPIAVFVTLLVIFIVVRKKRKKQS